MKKRIILLVIIAAVISAAVFTLSYVASHHTVTFVMKNGEYNMKVFTSDNKQIAEVSSPNKKLWLQKGEYKYSVSDQKYDNASHTLVVSNKDQSVTINPDYSSSYLSELLTSSEQLKISTVLAPYLSKVSSTTLSSLQFLELHGRGEWATGKLSYRAGKGELPEYYRFVLHKDNDTWKVVVPPQIAIYSGDYPAVPISVLDSLY